MAQFLRPISDVSVGGWTTTPLWSKINGAAPNDASFISSISNPNPDTFQVGLTAISQPQAGSVLFRVRARKDQGGGGQGLGLNIEILQGTTVIVADQITVDLTGSFVTYTHTFTVGELAAVTNWATLSARISGTRTGGGQGRAAQVTWVEVETPDAQASTLYEATGTDSADTSESGAAVIVSPPVLYEATGSDAADTSESGAATVPVVGEFVSSGLVRHYRLVRGADTQVVYDDSTFASNGRLGNLNSADARDPVWSTDGNVLTFTSPDHYAPNSDSTGLPSGNADLTIMVAARRTGANQRRSVLGYGGDALRRNPHIHLSDGIIEFGTFNDDLSLTYARVNDSVPVVATFRYNAATLFFEGIADEFLATTSKTLGAAADWNTANTLNIGCRNGAATVESFNGDIYMVLMYARTLTDEEIRQNYAAMHFELAARGVTLIDPTYEATGTSLTDTLEVGAAQATFLPRGGSPSPVFYVDDVVLYGAEAVTYGAFTTTETSLASELGNAEIVTSSTTYEATGTDDALASELGASQAQFEAVGLDASDASELGAALGTVLAPGSSEAQALDSAGAFLVGVPTALGLSDASESGSVVASISAVGSEDALASDSSGALLTTGQSVLDTSDSSEAGAAGLSATGFGEGVALSSELSEALLSVDAAGADDADTSETGFALADDNSVTYEATGLGVALTDQDSGAQLEALLGTSEDASEASQSSTGEAWFLAYGSDSSLALEESLGLASYVPTGFSAATTDEEATAALGAITLAMDEAVASESGTASAGGEISAFDSALASDESSALATFWPISLDDADTFESSQVTALAILDGLLSEASSEESGGATSLLFGVGASFGLASESAAALASAYGVGADESDSSESSGPSASFVASGASAASTDEFGSSLVDGAPVVYLAGGASVSDASESSTAAASFSPASLSVATSSEEGLVSALLPGSGSDLSLASESASVVHVVLVSAGDLALASEDSLEFVSVVGVGSDSADTSSASLGGALLTAGATSTATATGFTITNAMFEPEAIDTAMTDEFGSAINVRFFVPPAPRNRTVVVIPAFVSYAEDSPRSMVVLADIDREHRVPLVRVRDKRGGTP